jgi:hypothetical protein
MRDLVVLFLHLIVASFGLFIPVAHVQSLPSPLSSNTNF